MVFFVGPVYLPREEQGGQVIHSEKMVDNNPANLIVEMLFLYGEYINIIIDVLGDVGKGVFTLTVGDFLLYEAVIGIEFLNCEAGLIGQAFDYFGDDFSRFVDPSDVREE